MNCAARPASRGACTRTHTHARTVSGHRRDRGDPGITSRTLRRKLEAEGTSYSELLASVRALAIDYLSTTTLSTEDIASTLGFSDAVGFRHAFKRWTGMTPSDVRRKRGG